MPDIGSLGASGAVVLVVGMFLKFMRDEAVKRDATYANVAKALKGNTLATKNADSYLRERNGRDAKSHIETLEAIKTIPTTMQEIADAQAKAIVAAVEVKEQHVEHQHIDTSVTDKKDE